MPINSQTGISRFVPQLSFNSTLTVADKGFESGTVHCADFSVLGLNISTSQKT